MARGWESKDVESQIEERGSQRRAQQNPRSPEEIERQSKHNMLMLTRTRVLGDLQRACNPRYRAMLEQALAHLDKQLAELRTSN